MSEGTRPSGTIAFLFTDVEGSTRLWAADADAMSASLRLHDEVMRRVVAAHGGYVFSTAGDSFAVAFDAASSAIDAACAVQDALDTAGWDRGPALKVRMGIHVGEAEERDGDYFGPVVNTAARVEAAGHGGQVLISDATHRSAAVAGIDLGEHLLRDVAQPMRLFQIGAGTFPPLRTTSVGVTSIPSPRTSLVGREDAITAIRTLVADHRLVTLTGVGGCGKTRLAIEVADREAPSRPAGVWFVDLTAVADDTAVPGAVAAVLDVVTDDASHVGAQIATYLAPRNALLVIDNCEHVLDEVADLLDVILEQAPHLRVLTTSREALEVEGEHTWRVPSLGLGPDSASVRLFVERARATADDFDPDPDAIEVIAEICERLDGIPLALELAAARVRTMSVVNLRDNLDDRFRLLSGGRRRSRQRQQTLEATVQWSYDLLSTAEQALLGHLAVFQGGFDPADVAAVADLDRPTAVDLIDALVAKSLVDVRRSGDDSVRFRLLETIRLFGLQRLIESGDAEATRDRHLEHFLTDPAVRDWSSYFQSATSRRVEREYENLRGAAGWALERARPSAAAIIGSALIDECMERGEANHLLAWLAHDDDLDRPGQVRCLAMAAHVRAEIFDLAGALAAANAAIDAAGDRPIDTLVFAHCSAAKAFMIRSDLVEAGHHLERALAVAPDTPSPELNVAIALIYRAQLHVLHDEFLESIADLDAALQTAPEDFTYRDLTVDFRDLALFFLGQDLPPRHQPRRRLAFGGFTRRYAHVHEIVDAIVTARLAGPERAAARLAAGAGESVARRPDVIGDWLGGFACLEALVGEDARARRILDNSIGLTLPALRPGVELLRQPPSGTVTSRRTQRSRPDEAVASVATSQPELLKEELARWSS